MEEKKYVKKADPHTLRNLINGSNRASALTSQRCTATSKRTGERCRAWALRGAKTCRVHGSATKASKVAAATRIAQASGYAADMLVEFMADPNVDIKQRTAIAMDLLGRAGVNGKHEVSVEVTPHWTDNIKELFVQYDDPEKVPRKQEDIVDAVIVDEQAAIEAAYDEESEQLERARAIRKRRGYSGAPAGPATPVKRKQVIRNLPPRQTRDVSGPDIDGPEGP